MGPCYCSANQGVSLDLGFFEQMERRLGAQGEDFAEVGMVAHEVGHHVQNLTGSNDRVRTRQGATSDLVRRELQADCLAGVWAHHATRTPAAGSDEPIITEITSEDIATAIDTAEATTASRPGRRATCAGQRDPRDVEPRLERAARPVVHPGSGDRSVPGLRHVGRRASVSSRVVGGVRRRPGSSRGRPSRWPGFR